MQNVPVLPLEQLDESGTMRSQMLQSFFKNMRKDAGRGDTGTFVVLHEEKYHLMDFNLMLSFLAPILNKVLQKSDDSRALSCPICDNIFEEPVTLMCGHNFCRTCLQKHERWEFCRECPLCQKAVQTETEPQINSALRRLSENYKAKRRGNNLVPESALSVKAVGRLQLSNSAKNGSCLVAPVITGSTVGNIYINIQGVAWFNSSWTQDHLFHPRLEASSFNKAAVPEFFDELAKVMDRYKFPPHMIYDAGITDVTTAPTSMQVVAVREQTLPVTSADGGERVTVVFAANAIGNTVPPMFIFPGDTYNDCLMTGAPIGSIGASMKNKDTFTDFLEHLAQQTHCSSDHPMLLIFDRHKSHVSKSALHMANGKGIVMLPVAPHTSHYLQPLNKSVLGPFRSFYNRALEGWMRSNQGKTASIHHIPGCVNDAYMSAMTKRNIISGFKSTGIFPFNRDIFSDEEFEPPMV